MKGKPKTKKKYLQYIYLTQDLYAEYIKKSYNSIRKQLSFFIFHFILGYSQYLPSGSFCKPLILTHQRVDRMKTTVTTTKLTKLITWTIALSNSMKLWAIMCSATQEGWVTVESSEKCGPLKKKGKANDFSILALRTPRTVWKGKKIGHWKMNFPDR